MEPDAVERSVKRARELFDSGYSCAESSLKVLAELYGLENDRIWTAASGLGGGVARHQSMCGALLGAALALGLREGLSGGGAKVVSGGVRPKVRRLLDGFRERFGAVDCRQLVPYDFNAPGGYEAFRNSDTMQQKCHHYVRYVVETLAKEHEHQARQR